jgi:hypothetical protein
MPSKGPTCCPANPKLRRRGALRCRSGPHDARTLPAPFVLARCPQASRAPGHMTSAPPHGFARQQMCPFDGARRVDTMTREIGSRTRPVDTRRPAASGRFAAEPTPLQSPAKQKPSFFVQVAGFVQPVRLRLRRNHAVFWLSAWGPSGNKCVILAVEAPGWQGARSEHSGTM